MKQNKRETHKDVEIQIKWTLSLFTQAKLYYIYRIKNRVETCTTRHQSEERRGVLD